MPKKFEEQLAALDALKAGGPTPETEQALRKALTHRNNYYVSKVAAAVEQLSLKQLIPDLLTAFARFFEQDDPQCWAKNALSKALAELGHDEPEPFLRGLAHIQMEPVWGGQADTAGTLRGLCALALVSCHGISDIEILRQLTPLLLDSDKAVRIEVARALVRLGREEGALLLRLRAVQGDSEREVLGIVFSSIIAMEGCRGMNFVARFLSGDIDVAEEAALALGESRMIEAFEILKRELETPDRRDLRRSLLTAIALMRLPESTAFLLDLIRREDLDASRAKRALLDYGALSEAERAQLQ